MHKNKTLAYFIFIKIILFTTLMWAQEEIDSLQQKSYTELLDLYLKSEGVEYIKAQSIISAYLEKAKKNQDTFNIAEAYYHFYNIASDETKLKYTDSIIYITKNKHNKDFPARAHFRKAQFFLFEKRNIKKTLAYLNKVQTLAKDENNVKLLYRIEYYLGIVRSEHLGEKEKAIQIFKKCITFYDQKTEGNYPSRYLYALHALAETYIGIKKYDSASYYNAIGYHKASSSTDNLSRMKTYFTLCEGINQYAQKKYTATIDSIYKALPKIIELKDKSNTIDSYFYLGKSYNYLNDKENSIYYFKKTDSVLETLKSVPQYKHIKTYEYLKNYYKNKDDLQNQNKYLNKLNLALTNYLDDQIFISKKVKEDYDIPLLLEEQQILIKKLNKNTNTYLSSILILLVLLASSGVLLYYQYKKKQQYRLRFEALITKDKLKSKSQLDKKENVQDIEKEINVPKKHVSHILNKLQEFEKNHEYLKLGISSQFLADSIGTNVKYLSRVINYYKTEPLWT